jgi:bifunctional non-homologous end joining protein LigD
MRHGLVGWRHYGCRCDTRRAGLLAEGELACAMMHTGRMARWAAGDVPVTFVAFDLLHLDGQDLTGPPLAERKRLLDELQLVGPAWTANGWYPGDGDTLFQVCAELGHEGVVAKRLDSPYLSGKRTRTWLKRKFAWKREHGPRRRPRVPA